MDQDNRQVNTSLSQILIMLGMLPAMSQMISHCKRVSNTRKGICDENNGHN